MKSNKLITRFIGINLVVACGYFVLGYGGTLLATAPSHASPVWPAAGLALASVLVYGVQVIPGLFLGALSITSYSYLETTTLDLITTSFIALICISLGSCVQALVGTYLVNFFLGKKDPLIDDAKILRFFLFGAFTSCLIGSFIGISILYFLGFITIDDMPISWLTWWIGDSIGISIFAPIILSFIAKPRSLWKERQKMVAYPLLITFSLVVCIFQYNQKQEAARIASIFERQVSLFHSTFYAGVLHHIEINEILKRFYDSSNLITKEEFATFTWPIIRKHQSIKALEWISYISANQRRQFENPEINNFTIREPNQHNEMVPATERAEYFPITYIEPLQSNQSAFGFDVGVNPVALTALLKAIVSGETVITEPLQLIQDLDSKTGFVIYSPVFYRDILGKSLAENKAVLKGFVAGVFRMEDEIKAVFSTFPNVQLLIKIKDQSRNLYSNYPGSKSAKSNLFSLQKISQIQVADKIWTVTYQPSAEFYHNQLSWTLWWILLSGFAITSLAGVGLLMLSGRTLRTEELVRIRTQDLSASEEHFRKLVQAQSAIVWRADPYTYQYTFVSDEAEKILGYPVAQWLEDNNFWINHMHEDDKKWALEFAISANKSFEFEYRMLSSAGEPIWLRDVVSLIHKDGKLTEVLGVMIDITAHRAAEQEVYDLAFYDPLTGLANRRLLLTQLNTELSTAKSNSIFGALLFIDLDRFKVLNDSLGHHVGDELLVQVSNRIHEILRQEDLAARLGGDEFVILIKAHEPTLKLATESTLVVAEKIRLALEQIYTINNYEYQCSSSIGITLFPEYNITAEELIQQADKAMYRSKDLGRNTISFFHSSLQKAADAKLFLEKELRLAINNQDFTLYYQPQIDQSGFTFSSEALIRWQHTEHGLISPAAFIITAEETGLIIPLGLWVLNQACSQMSSWLSEGVNLHHIAVNVSSKQFRQTDFVFHVEQALRNNKLDGAHLFIELTEGLLIDDLDDTVEKMLALKKIGVKISIDDFGTGYSSLTYLKRLPVDQLKIDQSFVRDISTDKNDAIIVETIISMARNLKFAVIAEGVETKEQKEFLKTKGCFVFQGYYFSTPLPADEFKEFLS